MAKGYFQNFGKDYDISSSVIQTRFQTLLVVAYIYIRHYDIEIETTCLNGDLVYNVYLNQPECYEEHLVCKLKKSLYSLQQSANDKTKNFINL